MEHYATIASFRKMLEEERRRGGRVGFVPTMGALHDGHLSLVERAHAANDVVVMSVFVNPLQFGPNEDLNRYPRPMGTDISKAEAAGVEHFFNPSVDEMYPFGEFKTSVAVRELADTLEGEIRPGHFDGVSTVVAKLFSIVGPSSAYFGEKDWQQLCVVRRLVADLSLPVDVVGCPIVREDDGLALSSRNVYLDPTQRKAALCLSKALEMGLSAVREGQQDPKLLGRMMFEFMDAESLVEPDYASCVDADMQVPDVIGDGDRLLVAARLGTTRLIDNMGVS